MGRVYGADDYFKMQTKLLEELARLEEARLENRRIRENKKREKKQLEISERLRKVNNRRPGMKSGGA